MGKAMKPTNTKGKGGAKGGAKGGGKPNAKRQRTNPKGGPSKPKGDKRAQDASKKKKAHKGKPAPGANSAAKAHDSEDDSDAEFDVAEYGTPNFLVNLDEDSLSYANNAKKEVFKRKREAAPMEEAAAEEAEAEEDVDDPTADESDEEVEDYERGVRQQKDWEKKDPKDSKQFELPIRDEHGEWTQKEKPAPVPSKKEKKEKSLLELQRKAFRTDPRSLNDPRPANDSRAETSEQRAREAAAPAPDSPESRAKAIAKARDVIAAVCGRIVEDPESSMGALSDLAHLYPGDKMPEGEHHYTSNGDAWLRSTARESQPDGSTVAKLADMFTVKKLVILSQLAVFKDIIPGYRIRPPSDEEKAMKVSKDVRQQRDYEGRLLTQYQLYLQRLAKLACIAQKQAPPAKELGLALVAVQCLAELLKVLHHFNFSGNIVSALIPITDSPHESVLQPARSAVIFLLKNTTYSSAAVTAVKQIDQHCQRRKYRMSPECLRCMLALRLTEDADEKHRRKKNNKKDGLAGTSKQTKAIVDSELERDMAESEAVMPRETRRLAQAEMLRAIFLTYFRIIKSPATVGPGVLRAALDGVARFAHLISVDFLGDLFAVLNDLLRNGGVLPDSAPQKMQIGPTPIDAPITFEMSLSEALTTVHTALALLSGPRGEVLEIDPATTCTALYFLLPDLADNANTALVPVALDALRLGLLQRRQLSMERVAAFVKALLSVAAAATPASVTLSVLALVSQLADKYPRIRRLLDANSTEAVVGRVVGLNLGPHGGKFRLDVEPDHSNALSTSAWELAALKQHWHPAVAEIATAIAAGDRSMNPGSQMQQVFSMAGSIEGAKAIFRLFHEAEDAGENRPDVSKRPKKGRNTGAAAWRRPMDESLAGRTEIFGSIEAKSEVFARVEM